MLAAVEVPIASSAMLPHSAFETEDIFEFSGSICESEGESYCDDASESSVGDVDPDDPRNLTLLSRRYLSCSESNLLVSWHEVDQDLPLRRSGK